MNHNCCFVETQDEVIEVDALTNAVVLKGFSPYINTTNNHWMVYDNETKSFVDTGVVAIGQRGEQGIQGLQGIQGEQGPQGDTYTITQTDYQSIANIVETKYTRRLINLEEAAKGNIYRYDTDTTEAYTKAIAEDCCSWASLDKLGGKSVVINQLSNPTDRNQTTNGIAINITNGKLTCSGTATASFNLNVGNIDIVNEHKYLIVDLGTNYPMSSASEASLQVYASGVIVLATFESSINNMAIGTATGSGVAQFRHRFESGNTYNFTTYPMLIDLTQMGLADITLAEAQAIFTDYIPYNQGELKSANVDMVISRGANLWDEEWRNGYYSNGVFTPLDSNICSTNLIDVSPRTQYYVVKPSYNIYYTCYDKNGDFINKSDYNTNGRYTLSGNTFTTPSDTYFITFNMAGGYGTTYSHDIAIVEGTSGTYSPYREPIEYTLPSVTLRSCGNIHDYVDYNAKKVVRKVGVVDLGSLTWTYNQAYNVFFTSQLRNICITNYGICENYSLCTTSMSLMPDQTIFITSNDQTYIKDSNYTNAQSLKESLQGKMLYYALATPTEETIAEWDNAIMVEANGSITFHHDLVAKVKVPNQETFVVRLGD